MAIACDLDGIVADFTHGFSRHINEMTGGAAPIVNNYSTVKTWAWETWYWPGEFDSEMNEQAWHQILQSPDFWLELHAIFPEQMGLLKRAARRIPIVFMTRRDGNKPYNQTLKWLQNWGVKEPMLVRIHSGEEKSEWCKALGIRTLIDDSPKNMEEAKAAGLNVVTITWPYNMDVSGVHRAADLAGALQLAEEVDSGR